MVPEAPLEDGGHGLVPQGEGWFVVNAREARWEEGAFGAFTRFEGEARFSRLGINLSVLPPGTAACMYHGEDAQERAMGMVRQNAWLLYDAGKASKSPDEFGIERP